MPSTYGRILLICRFLWKIVDNLFSFIFSVCCSCHGLLFSLYVLLVSWTDTAQESELTPIHNTSGYLVACIWYSNHNLSSALEITSSLPTQGVWPWSCTLFITHSCGPLRGSVSIQASSSIIDKFPISERSSKSTSSRRSYWCVYQGGCWRRDEENK